MVTGRAAGDGTEFMAHMTSLRVSGRVDLRDGIATGHVYAPEDLVALVAEAFLIDVKVTPALTPPEQR
jgi:hypothetical protein